MNSNIKTIIDKFIWDSEKFTAKDVGNYGIVSKLQQVNYSDDCFEGACKIGHIKMISLLIPEVNDLNDCMKYASVYNRLQIIDVLLIIGVDYFYGFIGACEGGHLELLIKMIGRIIKPTHLEEGLYTAAKYGHLHIVLYLLNRNVEYDLEFIFDGACEGGNLLIIDILIKKGANNWGSGLEAACRKGHLHVANLMIRHGANNWNEGLAAACEGGHMELVKLMIEKGANNWNEGLRNACEGGHMELANLMIRHGANDWNEGLRNACEGGHMELANLMIKHGANDWNWGLTGACEGGHLKLVKLMIKNGANRCDNCQNTKHKM